MDFKNSKNVLFKIMQTPHDLEAGAGGGDLSGHSLAHETRNKAKF